MPGGRGQAQAEREAEEHGTDYAGLHRWSVTDLEGFWGAVWEYFAVDADTPYERVLAEEAMPGARWFTGAPSTTPTTPCATSPPISPRSSRWTRRVPGTRWRGNGCAPWPPPSPPPCAIWASARATGSSARGAVGSGYPRAPVDVSRVPRYTHRYRPAQAHGSPARSGPHTARLAGTVGPQYRLGAKPAVELYRRARVRRRYHGARPLGGRTPRPLRPRPTRPRRAGTLPGGRARSRGASGLGAEDDADG